jgi:hypothetical protein
LDIVSFAQKLWAIANTGGLPILLLTVTPNYDYAPSAERRLAGIASLTRDRRIKVEPCVMHGKDWIKSIHSIVSPGDLIICHTEQKCESGHSKNQLLYTLILSELKQPVYVLNGIYTQIKPLQARWLAQLPYWVILFTIIAGFFLFETQIDLVSTGWIEKTLFGILFLIEVSMIWIWNSIMG